MNKVNLINLSNSLHYFKSQSTSAVAARKVGKILQTINQPYVTLEDISVAISSTPGFRDKNDAYKFEEIISDALKNTNDLDLIHSTVYSLAGSSEKGMVFHPELKNPQIVTPGELINCKNYLMLSAYIQPIELFSTVHKKIPNHLFTEYVEIGVVDECYSQTISQLLMRKIIMTLYLTLKGIVLVSPERLEDETAHDYINPLQGEGRSFAAEMELYESFFWQLITEQMNALSEDEQLGINHEILKDYVESFFAGFKQYISDLHTGYIDQRITNHNGIVPYFVY